ncbi:hypothetical protein CK556_02685 [Mesoplasma chauliocola]|uniref:Uncharacterized protein n=1 Tax=Mesoplasma chauliocola TaxID=216427 RepID=A0A249SNN9_9MOLU|nr:hypothetical protein [Mesoplasma chauliocola]ASZ09246.1 hypothetical protein CK556_02685 [Mesoplasma chauliocola]
MKEFKYEKWLMQFINDDWYIQSNTSENNVIYEEVSNLKDVWFEYMNYDTFLSDNEEELSLDELPGFFENEDVCKTDKYIKEFISGVFHLRMVGLYTVVKEYVEKFNLISEESFNAIDENGIDVSINKTFVQLTEKYYEELINMVKNFIIPDEFKYCWKDLLKLVERIESYTKKEDKLDVAYQILEFLTNTIDGFDDLEIDLPDQMIESANKFICILIKYEIIFDRLILLKEHLEYQYVETKKLPENLYRANIMDRYQEINTFKAINEEEF